MNTKNLKSREIKAEIKAFQAEIKASFFAYDYTFLQTCRNVPSHVHAMS